MNDLEQNSVKHKHTIKNSFYDKLKTDMASSGIDWYLKKIDEMNLQYEGENKNIVVQYPSNCDKYICIGNQVRDTNKRDLLNDIYSIFSSVECLNVKKKRDTV